MTFEKNHFPVLWTFSFHLIFKELKKGYLGFFEYIKILNLEFK